MIDPQTSDVDTALDRRVDPVAEDDPDEMLALFRGLRSSHLRLWAGSSESDRARIGIHAERGPESFDLSFRLVAGHGLFHLGQMRRTLAQVAAF